MKHLLFIPALFFSHLVYCQKDSIATPPPKPSVSNWYEKISIRGYGQFRYNRLLETNPDLGCEQCDKSWGGDGGFFIRRLRVIIFGQITERVYLYIQPDFASAPTGYGTNFAQLRDAYFDVGIDKDNEFRFRVGLSKVPYGFENMQSSQNRLPLDRNDALNSALSNERDLGVMFYWVPKEIRHLYSRLVRDGLKGSGDYGLIGFGVYNGQTANKPEANDNKHIVGRFTYPVKLGEQIIEPGIQAYTGYYTLTQSQISSGVGISPDFTYRDQRIAGTFVLYPQPFGIQAEYNIGEGPEYNSATDSIELQPLKGGYATFSYLKKLKNQVIIPYTRIQYYSGGKKHEQDARSHEVKEVEIGIEWQPFKSMELVSAYVFSSRRFEDHKLPNNLQEGQLLRLQLQVNF